MLRCDVVEGTAAAVLRQFNPDVLVVDDPIASDARQWIAQARRIGCPVVTVHDLGLGAQDGDLVVDGSVARTARAVKNATRGRYLANRLHAGSRSGQEQVFLRGPEFALLDPVFGSVTCHAVVLTKAGWLISRLSAKSA